MTRFITKLILIFMVFINMFIHVLITAVQCEAGGIRKAWSFFLIEPVFLFLIYPLIIFIQLFFIIKTTESEVKKEKLILIIISVVCTIVWYYINYNMSDGGLSLFIYENKWKDVLF